jgi:hypothetical protein
VTSAHLDSEIISKARELHRSGVDAQCLGQYHDADELLRRGLDLANSIEPRDPSIRTQWQVTRIRLSSTLALVTSEFQGPSEALARMADVLKLIEELPDPLLRLELSASVEHNSALVVMSVGFHEEGLVHLDASVGHQETRIASIADPEPLFDPFVKSLRARGTVYTLLGQVGPARQDLTRAFTLATEHGLLALAADASHALGKLELRSGDIPAALRRSQESDRAYREQGMTAPTPLQLTKTQSLLAAGLADEAGTHLDQVVLPALRGRQSATRDLGGAELFRAAAAFMTEDLDLARSMAASARQRMRRWGCETCVADATLIGLRVDTLLALRSGKVPKSLSAKALRFADELPIPRLTEQAATARMLAARLEIRRGNVDSATEILRLVPRPGRLTPIGYRMLRRLCRAELAVAKGGRGAALAEIRAGLADLEQVRDRMGGLELVSATALHGRELSDLAIQLVLDTGNAWRLFSWLELTRAQTYRYEPLGVEDPELAERIAEVRSLTQSIHQAQHDGHPTTALQARRAERLREANRLGWQTARWGKPRPVAGLTEVVEQLGTRALVSFVTSEDSLVAVVVVDGDVRLARLGSASQAAESARMLNVDLNALAPDHLPPPLVEVVSVSARKQADLVDSYLVQPLKPLIEDRDLVIVPTGPLYAVPWGVLPTLLSRPTVVAPSATAWLAAERAGSPQNGRTVLVRGPGLPAAVGEIDKLGAHHRTAKLLFGKHATVSAVLEALDGAEVAHVAAHGAHEPENALFSRLELADGALFAHEMAGLSHPPRQVVLAACELALNRIRPGDEALGFASALLASGSQTVIAALSRVGDQASAAAMDDYHRGLAAGAKPAVALANAIAVDPLRRPFVCLGSG